MLAITALSDDVNPEKTKKPIQEEINYSYYSYEDNGSDIGGNSEPINPIEVIDLNPWSLSMPDQCLTYRSNQWVRNNGESNVYFFESWANPEGIVDLSIVSAEEYRPDEPDNGNYLRMRARSIGTTTVTASVYNAEGYTATNSMGITVFDD